MHVIHLQTLQQAQGCGLLATTGAAWQVRRVSAIRFRDLSEQDLVSRHPMSVHGHKVLPVVESRADSLGAARAPLQP